MKSILLGCLTVVLSSCQVAPTVATTEQAVMATPESRHFLKTGTVIFDTRSTYEFNLHRLSGAISVPSGDFITSRDPLDASKRLALWGVNPETPVVVVGTSFESVIELAWELTQAGLENIETYSLSRIRTLNVQSEPAKQNVAIWTPGNRFETRSRKDFEKKNSKLKISKNSLVLQVGDTSLPFHLREAKVKKWNDDFRFNEAFFLVRPQTMDSSAKTYDQVYLLDSSTKANLRAYVASKSGLRKLILVK